MILAFDIGTTVLKGALLTEDGLFHSFASRPMTLCGSSSGGCYEADTAAWKNAFVSVSAELTAGSSSAAGQIRAVVISGNGPTLVPVDENGSFLDPVMTWMDRRGVKQSEKISELQDFYIDPTFYLPKAAWIADEMPEVYEKTRYFLSCPEAMTYWLTGEAVTVLPGLKFEKYFWNDELIDGLGLDKQKFPGFQKPGFQAGKISTAAARESGLPPGIPVIAAGPDFIVTLLGTAAVYPGRACDRSGTSEGINLCTEKYVEDPRLMGYGHVVEPWYNVSGIISTSGKALEWIREQVGREEDGYAEFLTAAEKAAPGADRLIFLPYLTGERAPHWDPSARGAFIGLSLHHGRAEMVRAVLESIGFAMRDVIGVMSENDAELEELRITGGPSKSALWNQIKADITGKRILIPESAESELLGNLVLALDTLGDEGDKAAAADRVVKIKKIFEPGRDNHAMYSDYFELYRESYKQLKEIFGSLKKLG